MKPAMATLAAAVLAAACSSGPVPSVAAPRAEDIVALRWLAEGHDPVAFLTTQPAECRARSADPQLQHPRELGRIAFESPALLGGAAGRMRLACSSCHLNGQDNPHFFIEGVSADPGTADVTSSLFSKIRGDDAFNPQPIPNITTRDGKQIKDRKSAEFRAKVHGLVVEEFDGQEPPTGVFEMMLSYLDSLDATACADASAREPITVSADLDATLMSLAVAHAVSDEPAKVFWLRTARLRLERIHERYVGPELAEARGRLEALSGIIGEEQAAVQEGRLGPDYVGWNWEEFAGRMLALESRSLYNPEVLQAALAE